MNFRGEDLWDNHLLNQNIDPVLHSTCDYCRMSAWNVKINAATMQSNLVIAQAGEPTLNIDSFEIAQFIDLLLNNTRLRLLLDTITSKVVLILGHFTSERKVILNAIQEGLRKHDYLPVLLDTYRYLNSRNILDSFETQVIFPAEARVRELGKM